MPGTITLRPQGWKQRLHDGPLQEAIGLWMQARCAPELADVATELEGLVDALRELLADEGLPGEVPPAEGTGFRDRLAALVERCGYARVSIQDLLPPHVDLSAGAAAMALRVVAEALANLRHAEATTAIVTVDLDGDALWVSVTDDGAGFDVATALQPRPGHLGLAELRRDVADAGGRLRIRTVPQKGSRIQAELPGALHPAVLLRISA